jgi:hypothetical protein
MDKETLSNYGWVVICVLVLAVMIALATPFGSFIAGAVENTTESLFGASQKAMNTGLQDFGVTVKDQEMSEVNTVGGGETTPDTNTPENEAHTPIYIQCTTIDWDAHEYTYEVVDEAPAVAGYGDMVIMDNYVYTMPPEHAIRDDLAPMGWDVALLTAELKANIETTHNITIPHKTVTLTQTTYPEITWNLYGRDVLLLTGTFNNCVNMIETPLMPVQLPELRMPFTGCTSLKTFNYAGTIAQFGYDGYYIMEISNITEFVCSDGNWIADPDW